ncbi:glucuronate isomerase [Chryseolinea soli]|uniref:Uronate isomerase n=1 Tax=Chryseolinea soli TaxID=2321403 RepID=A0A385SU43_9BACT|nr:glucuronate isomerase [Chryseolinea soli]AYB34392.1 glucuronate isomerase [Chryseolinea soli]
MIKTSKTFLGDDFLLGTDAARHLYEQYAATQPIIDYHNHLSPKDIAENRRFDNLTELWLEGDHYKWRGMRANGVAERYCTGNATPQEKFMKWAETVPYTLRNPLFHWTHLELKNYFGITTLLDASSALEIYETCNAQLQQEDFFVQGLLAKMNVEVLCTTDDPIDSLEYHRNFAAQHCSFRMFPTFRPDKSFAVENVSTYLGYIEQLGAAAGTAIRSFDELLQALKNRLDFFHQHGCRVSDHGLDQLFFDERAESEAPALFKKLQDGKTLDALERIQFKSAVLLNLGRLYHKKGWVQQFHLGAMRNNNTRLLRELGPDTGFDSMGEYPQGHMMSRFFDALDNTNQLAKTIVYNLNPADNELFATMVGNFNDGTVAGKMQYGSGWWFLDQKDGMERQMNTLSNMGLLSRFVGMVTDSRSFLSFPRHEYFRRILCNLVGNDIEKGELPDDYQLVGRMVKDISYTNAKTYFGF